MDEFLRALREFESKLNQYIRVARCSDSPSEHQAHDIHEPATQDELEALRSMGGEDLISIYEKCNGLRLCAPDESKGVLIYRVDDIPKGNEEWKPWLSGVADDELWGFQRFGLAFGEIAGTANYLVVYQGRVFYADHEGAEGDDPWAESLCQFFSRIADEPGSFLDSML